MLSACCLIGAYFLAVSSHKRGRLNTSVYGTVGSEVIGCVILHWDDVIHSNPYIAQCMWLQWILQVAQHLKFSQQASQTARAVALPDLKSHPATRSIVAVFSKTNFPLHCNCACVCVVTIGLCLQFP